MLKTIIPWLLRPFRLLYLAYLFWERRRARKLRDAWLATLPVEEQKLERAELDAELAELRKKYPEVYGWLH